jgi:iron(III) transport system substrate-binding protein
VRARAINTRLSAGRPAIDPRRRRCRCRRAAPSAARLFAIYLFSRAGQQLMVDMARIRSVSDVKLPDGMKPLAEIKVMKPDPAAQEKETATIKEKYAEYFGL